MVDRLWPPTVPVVIGKSAADGLPTVDHGSSQATYPPTYGVYANAADDLYPATFTDVRPVNILDREIFGVVCPMFVNDYYFRVYVTPSQIPLGNLVSAQFRTFDVWNAWFVPQNNSDLTFVGDNTGIILTEPLPTPTIFGALESRQYSLNFALTGPPAINIEYTWTFPVDSPTLLVTGNRVIIFAIPPDWSEEVTERYEWLTQINESEDGWEDRYRLRVNPRRSLEYRLLIQAREKRWLERYLWSWKGRAFAIPIQDQRYLSNHLFSLA